MVFINFQYYPQDKAEFKTLFVCRHPTNPTLEVPIQIFYWTSKRKQNFQSKKTFPTITDYFKVKFYFSNPFLNSVEHIHYFPQQLARKTMEITKRY